MEKGKTNFIAKFVKILGMRKGYAGHRIISKYIERVQAGGGEKRNKVLVIWNNTGRCIGVEMHRPG